MATTGPYTNQTEVIALIQNGLDSSELNNRVEDLEISNEIITVNTYSNMLTVATGDNQLKIFVIQASQYNEPNEFFTYIPTKGIAYLGIDFNYTD